MYMPKQYLEASATVTDAKRKIEAASQKKVTARIDMSAEVAGSGLCPECRKPMVLMSANGHQVHTCMDDRITVPVRDEQ